MRSACQFLVEEIHWPCALLAQINQESVWLKSKGDSGELRYN